MGPIVSRRNFAEGYSEISRLRSIAAFAVAMSITASALMFPVNTPARAEESPVLALSKTVDRLDDANPDTSLLGNDFYRLYLDVTNNNYNESNAVDLLFVVDQSGSMFEMQPGENEYRDVYVSRLLNGEANANSRYKPNDQNYNRGDNNVHVHASLTSDSLIQKFLQTNPDNKVAVIGFDADRRMHYDNNQFPAYANEGYSYATDSETILGWTSSLNSAVDVTSHCYTGTNYEAGFLRADAMFDEVRNDGNDKIMVFLSDGVPTCYINDNDGNRGGNTLSSDYNNCSNCRQPSLDAFNAFRSDNPEVKVYSVGIGNEVRSTSDGDAHSNYVIRQCVANGGDYSYFDIGSSALADKIFSIIEDNTKTRNVSVTDELSQYVEFYAADPDVKVTMTDTSGNTSVLYEGGAVTSAGRGILSGITYTPSSEAGTTGTVVCRFDPGYAMGAGYKYELSYNVVLTQTAYDEYIDSDYDYSQTGDPGTDYGDNETSSGAGGFYSNAKAYVTYDLNGETISYDPDVTDSNIFDHPVVQVDTTSLTVNKVWSGDEAGTSHDDVTVQLYRTKTPYGATPTVTSAPDPSSRVMKELSVYDLKENGEYVIRDMSLSGVYYLSKENNVPSWVHRDNLSESDTSFIWVYDGSHLRLKSTGEYLTVTTTGNLMWNLSGNPGISVFLRSAEGGGNLVNDRDNPRYSLGNIYYAPDGHLLKVYSFEDDSPVVTVTPTAVPGRETYGSPVTLQNGTYTYEHLQMQGNEDGVVYSYSYDVEEVSVPDGYEVSYSEGDTGSLVITNTRIVPTVTPGPTGDPDPTVVPTPTEPIVFSKTIDSLGDGVANPDTDLTGTDFYRLYLDIEGKVETTPVDLLIVVDQSGSMFELNDVSYEGRNNQYRDVVVSDILNGQASVNRTKPADQNYNRNNYRINATLTDEGILSQFLAANPDNKVAVIGFDADRRMHYDNNVFPAYAGEGYSYLTDSTQILDWTSDLNSAVDVTSYCFTGTNYEAGFLRAADMFDKPSVKNDGHDKVMIFISDGVPTCYISANGDRGGTTMSGNAQNVIDCRPYTLAAFGRFRSAHPEVDVYSVGISNELKPDPTDILSDYVIRQCVAGKGNYFYIADDGDSLNDHLMGIIGDLIPGNVVISDKLSQYVEYYSDDPDVIVSMTDDTGAETVLYENGAVTSAGRGIIKSVVHTPSSDSDSTGTVVCTFEPSYRMRIDHRYSLSYNVKVTDTAYSEFMDSGYNAVGDGESDYGDNSTSSGQDGFYSNNSATVSYYYDGKSETGTYDHPVIQVDEDSVMTDISVIKNWEDDNGTIPPIEAVQVQLYQVATLEETPTPVPTAGPSEGHWEETDALVEGERYLIQRMDNSTLLTNNNNQADIISYSSTDISGEVGERYQWLYTEGRLQQVSTSRYLYRSGDVYSGTWYASGNNSSVMHLDGNYLRTQNNYALGDPYSMSVTYQFRIYNYVTPVVTVTPTPDPVPAEGVPYGEPVYLSSANQLKHDFRLPSIGFDSQGNKVTYTYYIVELNTEGKDYTVSYSADSSSPVDEGTIRVTNRYNGSYTYELPLCGGPGDRYYYMGAVLTGGTILWFCVIYTRKRRSQHHPPDR